MPFRAPRLHLLTRNIEAPLLFETFFVAAVASFLGIRWFLASTGYPKIGSDGLHIAHMLWGGLLLLLAVVLLIGFLNSTVGHVAAGVAGFGFGTFIDEIGKFVTSDNDYFFRPSIAMIYGVFVIVFLVARVVVGRRKVSADEALANALGLMAAAPTNGLEPDDRSRIHELLKLADPADPRTRLAMSYLAAIPGIPDHDNVLEVAKARLASVYARVMALSWADEALIVIVVAYAVLAVASVTFIASLPPANDTTGLAGAFAAQVGSTLAGAVLVGLGVVSLRRSRISAYHWFQRGLLVWILVTQVFVFYSSQFGGLAGLAVDLVAYGSLRYAIRLERAAQRAAMGAAPDNPPDGE